MSNQPTKEVKKIVVSVKIDKSHEYEYTVEIPLSFVTGRAAWNLTGINHAGEKITLRGLASATLTLLCALGHVNEFECREGDKGCWKFRRENETKDACPRVRVLPSNSTKQKFRAAARFIEI